MAPILGGKQKSQPLPTLSHPQWAYKGTSRAWGLVCHLLQARGPPVSLVSVLQLSLENTQPFVPGAAFPMGPLVPPTVKVRE